MQTVSFVKKQYHLHQTMTGTATGAQNERPNPAYGSRAVGSIALPGGSPWCPNNSPTLWYTGHQAREHPWCLVQEDGSERTETTVEKTAKWKRSKTKLNLNDKMNRRDGKWNLDRHACVAMDGMYDYTIEEPACTALRDLTVSPLPFPCCS